MSVTAAEATADLRLVREGRVEVSISGSGVALLRMNRLDKMNALDGEQIDALAAAFSTVLADDEVRVVVLTGSDAIFCAGGDISTFDALDAGSGYAFTRKGYDLLRPLEMGQKPVISAVEGYCLAGGLELALACDMIVCGEGARFGFGEVDLGLIPGWGGTVRLARAIPARRARQMVLTSERIDAAEALRLGLVNEVLAAGGALERALELAEVIASKPPVAVSAAKMVLEQASDGVSSEAALATERSVCAALFGTDDVHRLVQAWTDKARSRESRG